MRRLMGGALQPGGTVASLMVGYSNTPRGNKFRELMKQGLGAMVGDVTNYTASDHNSNWNDVEGYHWPTLYQMVEGGPNHVTVFVAMNETQQSVNFFTLLGQLRTSLLRDLLDWASRWQEHFGGELKLAVEWSTRPCAGAVMDLATGKITGQFEPEY
jgi:hypothetical protein